MVAWYDYTPGENTLTFWRTRSGVEVNFVLHGPLGFWAIEVKNTNHISLEDYPEAKTIFLHRRTDRLMKGNIFSLPCAEFLSRLKPNQPLI